MIIRTVKKIYNSLLKVWFLIKIFSTKKVTIYSKIDAKGIKNIDVLKIDSESNELNILKGAKNLLSENKIYLIYTEISESKKEFYRKDLRLTVDYPEDLVLCRAIYKKFIKDAPMFSIKSIVRFLDKNPKLKNMVKPYVRKGYSTMYKWGK